MADSPSSSPLDRLRTRLDALPLDRAPLRRAGVLTVLLVVLLVLGKAFSPRGVPAAERHDVRAGTEEVSAPGSAWTGGRVLAVLFLLTGGGVAVWLHRRAPAHGSASGSALEVLETHPLGPGHSLRLVACGDEVMLLSVAAEGASLLRHWPRAAFASPAADAVCTPGGSPVSFADALAELAAAPAAVPRGDEATAQGDDERHRPAPAEALPPISGTAEPAAAGAARGALYPARAPRQFSVR